MANVFIHFEPIGPVGGQVQTTGDLPPYVIPGSPAEQDWRDSNPKGHRVMGKRGSFATGSTELHQHVIEGNWDKLLEVLDKHEHLINVRDENGWTALHEAIRKGETSAVELLLNRGAEINLRTGKTESGESPLTLAEQFHGPDHEVTQLLVSRGARAEL